MSQALYPLGIINQHKVTPFSSVVADAFEDGSTAARALWAQQNFKRQITFQHPSLTLAEYRYLRSFYSQRSGMYDSFWYRDNVNRKGNVNVRFAAEIADQNDGTGFTVPVSLAEIAPIRALPEWDEVATAAGFMPVLWFDANREMYLSHMGTIIQDAAAYDAAFQQYPAPWQANFSLNLGGVAAQYQTYDFSGVEWALTSANLAGFLGAQPACTIFLIARQSTATAKQILCALGSDGGGTALGIALDASGHYTPWVGASETWTTAKSANSPVDTFRSVCAVWSAASNNATLCVNGASIGTDSNTRTIATGPASIGASPSGALICNADGSQANNNLAQILVFAAALTLAQIKAVHNLLGYQYGLATVS